MENIIYYNETLWPGQWGHFAIIASFVMALLSAFAYYKSETTNDRAWHRLGRYAFTTHAVATLAVIGLLFYIMLNRMYEYEYAWAHVSDILPFKYMFSAFWEDQAGSFLLWAFWHIVLGFVLFWTARKWEAPVMVGLSLIQVFILSMLLGIYLIPGGEGFKLGFNPFMLLRDSVDAPIFQNADYLSLISGKGLNPLLQNYWMTIHPPTLFLGFASTAIPFCYAMAALWRRDARGWLQPVLPWALFSGAILGLGILMGAAWAYEALSFGGYWAWDPVENMSLVPWLILIAGIHTNLIARQTDHSIRATLVFYGLTFVLVLFSTFLTRSGILGDSSVHSFTEMGLEWQLVMFILFFLGWFLWMYVARQKSMAPRTDEEPLLTREFWMFIGSLVLLFSAVLITFTTSIPVYNKLADGVGWIVGKDFSDLHRTLPLDPIEHYNKYQFWIAMLLGFLTGFTQFMRYKSGPMDAQKRRLLIRYGVLLAVAAALTWLTWNWLGYRGWAYHLLLFSAWFAVVGNLHYLVSYLRGNMKLGASTIAHIGFGLMIVGIVASGVKKQHISQNRFAMEGILPADIINKNVLLFKNRPLLINGYKVTYLSDTLIGHLRTYEIQFDRLDEHGHIAETFLLYPDVQFDNDFLKQAASNPSTKRYFFKDVFTHISGLPPEHSDVERAKAKEDSLRYLTTYLMGGESRETERHTVTLGEVWYGTHHPDYEPEEGDIVVTANLLLREHGDDTTYVIQPTMVLRDNLVYNYPAKSNDLQVKARLNEKLFQGFMPLEDTLQFTSLILREGEETTFGNYRLRLEGYEREPEDPRYQRKAGDISIAARIGIRGLTDTLYYEQAAPIFLIRDGMPFGINVYAAGSGLHLRFSGVNPNEATISLDVARDPDYRGFPVDIAENYMRDDYLVLEAILFPGINFFWLGSTLMMVGLGLGAWNRRRSRPVEV